MLEKTPGAMIHIGNGPGSAHSSTYDFNDEILPIGVATWARLVETVLAKK
jgi:hippurate hydrolase